MIESEYLMYSIAILKWILQPQTEKPWLCINNSEFSKVSSLISWNKEASKSYPEQLLSERLKLVNKQLTTYFERSSRLHNNTPLSSFVLWLPPMEGRSTVTGVSGKLVPGEVWSCEDWMSWIVEPVDTKFLNIQYSL